MRKNDGWHWDLPVALVLLSRLPLPRLPDGAFAAQARAAWAFPLAGALVATLAAGLGWVALALGLPVTVCAGLVIAAQIVMTGAMHEDGLADTADGLWGGWSRDRRLEIMKDSHIGSYGVLALVLGVGLRWTALAALLAQGAAGLPLVIAVGALSRVPLPILMTALPQARPGGLAASVGTPGAAPCALALLIGLGIGVMLAGGAVIGPVLAASVAVLALAWVARVKIGGQTGDILGASQQLAELAMLCTFAAQIA
ncbi:MAG: adenosylcobinamide-GDP ribazoletransferase [Marinibacterium sp.]|nr:adenosylcobinamide-GDP ribazoletransferase [Marinibacterium sp.]